MQLARAATLLLLAAFACSAAEPHGSTPRDPLQSGAAAADDHAAAARLHPLLVPHSTACALASGWCPLELQPSELLLHSDAALGPTSIGSGGLNGSSASGSASEDDKGKDEPLPHKPLLPLSAWDVLGVVLASLALLLAASGGIGGGAILVPLNLMVLGFGTAPAVALSNITIVGGTLANLAFNVQRRHPARHGPLIDWDLIMVMEPSTILGALVGGYLNKILPGWLTTVSLSVLLALISYKTFNKGREIHARERDSLHHSLQRLSVVNSADYTFDAPATESLSSSEGEEGRPRGGRTPSPVGPLGLRPDSAASSGGSTAAEGPGAQPRLDLEAAEPAAPPSPTSERRPASHPLPIGEASAADELTLPLLSPIEEPQDTQLASADEQCAHGFRATPFGGKWPMAGSQAGGHKAPANGAGGTTRSSKRAAAWHPYLPWGKVAVLLLLLAGVVVSDVLKSQAACPSLPYWLAATAMVPVTLATLSAVRTYLLKKGAAQRASGHELLEGDVEWTPGSTLLYPALCSFAGLAAGIFGVGGGIIKGPLMLEMGVLPEVAAATSATMIFFTSAFASVVFISFGAVQWDYAAMLFTMGLICTAAGQLLVLWVNQHIKSRSLLVFVMATVLSVSSVALAVQGAQSTAAAAAAHDLWHFHGICGTNRSA